MTTATAKRNLGMTGYHSLELCLFDAEPWITWLTDGFGFQYIARNTAADQDATGTRKHLLRVNNVRFVLMEALHDGSEVKGYLRRHPEGIKRVNFLVEDIAHTFATLEGRNAAIIADISSEKATSGTWQRFAIGTALGEVEYQFVQFSGDSDLPPGFERIADFDSTHNPLGITHVDHLTSNVVTLQPLISFFENIMGMERYWKVQFHTDDIKPGVGSGLKSIVVWDEYSGIKFANNEPLRPRFKDSQIFIYVEDNNGPGVQHVAFAVEDILKTVDYCQDKAITFLPTPKTYYDAVPGRIISQNMGKVTHSIEDMEKRSLLIDGENGGYLLQIFCKEQAVQFNRPNAGPLFIEILQRLGCNGFGEGNFRALFESIEREQDETRAWKAAAKSE